MTTETIADNIERIEVKLPNTPLKATNSYLIRGDERNLLIDTGFNHQVSEEALLAALDSLGVDMDATDVFVTHLHSDHAGLAQRIARPGTRIYMSEEDGRVARKGRNSDFWQRFREFYKFTGLYGGGYVTSVEDHPGYAYAPPEADNITFVPDGHMFVAGGYRLRCIHTKGHTRGHFCLYEPDRRLLFSGDHILGSITPNITQMSFDHDALAEFLASLDLIARLEVDAVFPGHRRRIDDCRGRIAQLKRHHDSRLAEALAIVGDGRLNTVEVTRHMRWSLTIENWEDYPPAQKLFSAGEALAHLHHLTGLGQLRMSWDNGMVYFEKA